jgi:serine/threonine-protein kinase RsbW
VPSVTNRPITSSQPSSQPRRLELKVDSHPANLAAVRKSVESFATVAGFDDKAVAEIGLCLNEAMANVIRHAYSGKTDRPMHLSAVDEPEHLTIKLRDWGNGVDPSTLPSRPYNPLTPGGVGLICLQQWMDRVTYTPQPDGMLTTMVRKKKVRSAEC